MKNLIFLATIWIACARAHLRTALAFCIVAVSVFAEAPAHADVERWLEWEIERNELSANTAIFHPLPSVRSLEALQTRSVLEVVLAPSQAKILRSSLATPQLMNKFVDPRTGEIRFYIHPKALELFPRFKDAEQTSVLVRPTTSPRTVYIDGLMVKLSLPQKVNGAIRTVYPLQMERALAVSEMLAGIPMRERQAAGFAFLPEVLGIHDAQEDSPFGFLVRVIPDEILTGQTTLVPITAYTAFGKNGEPSLLEEDAARQGQAPRDHLVRSVIPALVRSFTLAASYGVVLEAHQQNTMLELDGAGRFTGRVFYRDMDGARVDFAIRRRAGLTTRHLETVSNADWVFDLTSLELISSETAVPADRPAFWSPLVERAFQEYLLGSSVFLLEKSLERKEARWWKAWLPKKKPLASIATSLVGQLELVKGASTSVHLKACGAFFSNAK